ncbi:Adenylylsulfate reductase subunit beta, partial [Geodia barretti]
MPTFVNPNACDACATEHQGPLCVYICPNDLMVLDIDANKGLNQEPDMCSECYACVKLCPQEAIHVRGYADFVPMGAIVQPHRTDDGLQWEVVFRDGRRFEFTYQSRTRSAGSVVPYEGFTE